MLEALEFGRSEITEEVDLADWNHDFCAGLGIPMSQAATLLLQAVGQGRTLAHTPWTLNGRYLSAWSGEGKSGVMTFKPDKPLTPFFSKGVTYLEVAYVDQGYRKLGV